MLPKGWKESTVGKALSIENTKRKPLNSEERSSIRGVYPYYGPTKIQDWINEYAYEGRYALIGEDGDHFLKYKTECMTQIAEGKFNVNNHAHVIAGTNLCTVDWFYFFFQNRSIAPFLSRQGAKRYKLSKASLEQIPLVLPPVSEQRKITKILSAWDRAIETTEKLIENSRAQKAALMSQLLIGKKRLGGFSGAWMKATLSELGTFGKGQGITKDELSTSGVPCIRYGDIYTKYDVIAENITSFISMDSALQSRKILTGDILFTCSGETAEEIGKCVTFLGEFDAYAGGDIVVFTEHKQCPLFLSYLLNSDPVVKQKTRFGQGHSVVHITATNLGKLHFQLPPIGEQKAIARVLFAAQQTVQKYQALRAQLMREKSALLQQLLTGKRRVELADGLSEARHA